MAFGFGLGFPRAAVNSGGAFAGAALALDMTSGNQTLDPRVTFTRTSNATVTGPDGTIGYAPHNLLTYSEQFDNAAWQNFNSSVTSNAVIAPDGTVTAEKLVENTATTQHAVLLTSPVSIAANTTYTFSIYVKAAGRGFAFIMFTNPGFTSNVSGFVNLSTGTITNVTNFGTATGATVTAESVGKGWWRVRVSGIIDATSTTANCAIYSAISGSNSSYTGDGASGIYIWGAQLNVGALQPYYPTTVKNLLGYTQEFDNAVWTKSNSFVQTNLLTYSEQFDNASGWSQNLVTVSGNTSVAPNGTTTADKVVATAAFGAHNVASAPGVVSGNSYTFSFYAKAGEYQFASLLFASAGFGTNTLDIFNLALGLVVSNISGTATITPVGGGWYRCSATRTASASVNSTFQIRALDSSVGNDYTGDGTSGIYIWGAQLVQGSSPGDYVTTYGTTRAVMYAAPDGTMTADKAIPTTVNGDHLVSSNAGPAISGTVYSFSVYAKAAEYSFLRLSLGGVAGGGFTFFNLATGTIGTTAGMAANEIIPVGNGWYRCSVRRAAGSSAGIAGDIYLTSADNQFSWTGDGTSGIYIWGAQLSDSASLNPYVYNPGAAPAASAYYGPRFDYDPVTLQPKGLLIEEQRTNLLTYSEQFDNAAWAKATAGVSANQQVAPDGTTTSDRFVPSAGLSSPALTSAFLAALGNTYTFSVYVKQDSANKFLMLQFDGDIWNSISSAERPRIWFDPTSGQITSSQRVTNSGVAVLSDGWFRVFMSAYCSTGASTNARVAMQSSSASTAGYTGDGTSGIYIWGAQLEAGSFPTSYIPTTTAAATRAADVAVMTGTNFSSWYRQDEGTLFADCDSAPAGGTAQRRIAYAGVSTDRLDLRIATDGISTGFNVISGGVAQAAITGAGSTLSTRIAGTYKANDFSAATNSVLGTPDPAGSVPTISQITFGSNGSSESLNGHIRRIAYFPRRLSNAELQGITA